MVTKLIKLVRKGKGEENVFTAKYVAVFWHSSEQFAPTVENVILI